MDDWSQAWLEVAEQVAKEFEDFCREIGETVEEIATELQAELSRDLDYWFQEWSSQDWANSDWGEVRASFHFDLLDLGLEAEGAFGELNTPFARRLAATADHQPACIGCDHYHGYVYNGNLTVCGMHPYGWEGQVCPDWEAEPNAARSPATGRGQSEG